MVVVNPNRVWTVTDARPKLSSLVADAQSGQVAHISSNGRIVAHIVPSSTWIIDDQATIDLLLFPCINQEVQWAARSDEWTTGVLHDVGDAIGRVLGWAWRTDPDLFMRVAAEYVARLSYAVGRLLTLTDLDQALRTGLRAGSLGHSEIAAALAYAAQHWDEWWVPPTLPNDVPLRPKSSR